MKLVWTARGRKRFEAYSEYIASEFYPEYADAWEEDVARTVESLPDNPLIGLEAFPELNRPDIRKVLLHNKHYWVYYRKRKDVIEVLSVRHTLMNVDSQYKL